jgi:hypothetical protein
VGAVGAPAHPELTIDQPRDVAARDGSVRDHSTRDVRPGGDLARAVGNVRTILLVVFATTLCVLAWLWTGVGASLESALLGMNDWQATLGDAQRVALSAGIGGVGLLALVLAWARATTPGRPLTVVDGRTTARPSELASLLEDTLCMHHDVLSARVALENRGHGSVAVAVRIQVGVDTRLHEAVSQVRALIDDSVREGFGLDLVSAPAIDVWYDQLNLRPKGRHGHPESA